MPWQPCEKDGPRGTRLADCVKLYVPGRRSGEERFENALRWFAEILRAGLVEVIPVTREAASCRAGCGPCVPLRLLPVDGGQTLGRSPSGASPGWLTSKSLPAPGSTDRRSARPIKATSPSSARR